MAVARWRILLKRAVAPRARKQPKKLGTCIVPVVSEPGGMVTNEGGDVGSATAMPPGVPIR